MTEPYTVEDLAKNLGGLRAQIDGRNRAFARAHDDAAGELRGTLHELMQSEASSRSGVVFTMVNQSAEQFDAIVAPRSLAAELIEQYVSTHFPGLSGRSEPHIQSPARVEAPLGYRGVADRADALEAAFTDESDAADVAAVNEARDREEQSREARRAARKFPWQALVDVGFVLAGVALTVTSFGGLPLAVALVAAELVWKAYKASRWQPDNRARLRALRKPGLEYLKELSWEVAGELVEELVVGGMPIGRAIKFFMDSKDYIDACKDIARIWRDHHRQYRDS